MSGRVNQIGAFVHRQETVTIVFGVGEHRRLAAHVEGLKPRRILLIHGASGAALADRLKVALSPRTVATFGDVLQHVPATHAQRAVKAAQDARADTVVAIGGGSAIGYAKVIALQTGARIVAVPTTYAGSEMTPIWGITEERRKATGHDPLAMPTLVVYDPELTLTLSATASAASGLNAIAHAVDAMYAPHTSPLVTTMSVQAIELLAAALRAIVRDPADINARTQASYGAHLAALALGTTGMALHHRICHVLGGRYGLAHAETHAVILPHAAAYNQAAAAAVNAQIATALGAPAAAAGLWDLNRTLGLPQGLADLGMRGDDLEDAAATIAAQPGFNPAPVTRDGVVTLLRAAHAGQPPHAES
jgi:maleylacetate reductase